MPLGKLISAWGKVQTDHLSAWLYQTIKDLGCFPGTASQVGHSHSGLYPGPSGLFFDNQGIGFLVQTDGFFLVFHEVIVFGFSVRLFFQEAPLFVNRYLEEKIFNRLAPDFVKGNHIGSPGSILFFRHFHF
jgi:hypothetical protein